MSSDDVFPAVIVGAGLAGLTAAVHLAGKGIPPLVLEADSRWPGGRLSGGDPDTFEYDGRAWTFKPDQGVHALWGGYDNMRAMLDRFLDIQLQPSWGEEWINRWGREVSRIEAGNAIRSRWIPAPFHYLQLLFNPRIWGSITPLDFLSLPGILASIFLTVGFDPLREKNALGDLMMKDYFLGWTPTLRATFTGLGVNLLAAPADRIPLSAFIAAVRFYTMLRRDAWRLEYFPGNTHDCLIQPLIDRIESLGGMVMLGTEVDRLQRMDGGWKISVEDSRSGGRRSLVSEHIILAVDPASSRRILLGSPDTAQIAGDIRFPSALRNTVVRLWFSSSPRDGAPGGMLTGDFVPDNFFWFHRLYDEFREWHEVTGGSAIELHLYGTDELLDQPDENLVILAVAEVQRAFPELRGHFVHGVIRENIQTHTCFVVPTAESLHVETPWPGILACGDWVGYPTPALWMERASVTGIAAANHVLQTNNIEPYPVVPPRQAEVLVRILAVIIRFFRRILGPFIGWLLRRFRRNRAGRSAETKK